MQSEARPAYSSRARDQQARATRRAIVAAAGELFAERGYAATTIDAVATRAGVGRKTVFSSVGGKGALLKLVWDWALVGDDEPVPMAERPAVKAMQEERDPRRLVRMWVEMQLDVGARAAPVGAVVLAAADVDAEVRELAATIRRESMAGATAFVTHLAGTGGMRSDVSVEKGADVCWAVMNSLLWHLLGSVRGWAAREYGDWLDEVLSTTLLRPSDADPPARDARTRHVPEAERYEAFVEQRPAGHLSYQRTERLVVLTRTVVDPGFDDVAVADGLVRRALDDIRAEGATQVVAVCPYVRWWVERHPTYAGLLLHPPG
ncbi:MAG TPA: N-acetyltransferase [Nocardioidaceae bacterium]|nr:N-acetyltransferase [Nocardioidaceae bacterium]